MSLEYSIAPLMPAAHRGHRAARQAEEQVELRRPGPSRSDVDRQTGKLETSLGRVLECEHDLEQRVVRQGPGRVDELDQVLEGDVLVRIGGQAPLPHPRDQLGERRVTRRVRAQNQRIDEEPDQLIQRLIGAAGHRTAHRNILTRTQPGQQTRETRLQHHEQTRTRRPREISQTTVQIRVDIDGDVIAPVGHHRRTRTIRRQRQLIRQTRQRLDPVVDLRGEQAVRVVLVAEEFVLPQRVVRVLHRQRTPLRHPPLHPRRISTGQVGGKRAQRPPVTRDVMHDQDEDVAVGGEAKQLGTERDFDRQVEGVSGWLTSGPPAVSSP